MTEQDFYNEASKLTEGFVERVRGGGIWIYDNLRSLFSARQFIVNLQIEVSWTILKISN